MDDRGLKEEEDRRESRFTQEELARIERARNSPGTVVTTRPPTLSYLSIACIIVNRIVGTGIFRSPGTVIKGTDSVGLSLIFWVIGAVVSMAGILVYTEYGLTLPRLEVPGQEGKESVPRNGGEKNYLEYLLKKPSFLATCIYGVPFILLGNMAGNALVFAEFAILASGKQPSDSTIRGVAVAVITFACIIHTVWRSGGIRLNDFFGLVKMALLVMLWVVGFAAAGGAFGDNSVDGGSVAKLNFDSSTSLQTDGTAYDYTQSFLTIIFAYEGFNQANYVLGEIDDPRKKFKWTSIATNGFVCLCYILINIAYMLVVPKEEQINSGVPVATSLFKRVFGEAVASQVLYGLMAFSSLGNVIVQTFTAARVKQEIAKEGVLPWSTFFASNYDFTLFRRSGPQDGNAHKGAETPAAAFLLHWSFAILLIVASISQKPQEAYSTYVNLYSFTINCLFGFLVGLGLLYLRLNDARTHWSRKSTTSAWLSITSALIFTLGNLFPLVGVWIPREATSLITSSLKWFLTGTIGLGTVVVGLLWWVILFFVIPRIRGMSLDVDREPVLDDEYGYWVMWHEIVKFNWIVR